MVYDVVFKDSKNDGSTMWKRIGTAGDKDKGMYVKIDSIPVGFDGWLSLFPKDQNQQQKQSTPLSGFDKAKQVADQIKAKQDVVVDVPETEINLDDIPF